MIVEPSDTCPSAAITTRSPRRTQMTVVDRTRRPSPKSSGCPAVTPVESIFRTPQYTAALFSKNRRAILKEPACSPRSISPGTPATIAAAATGAASVLALGLWAILHKRPTPAELEQRRRLKLAATGRIVDGSLTGAEPDDHAPHVILYRYRIAGVTYECSQDISALDPAPTNLRLDFPIQVRYDRANPAIRSSSPRAGTASGARARTSTTPASGFRESRESRESKSVAVSLLYT